MTAAACTSNSLPSLLWDLQIFQVAQVQSRSGIGWEELVVVGGEVAMSQ
jgi:hypothetical protein